MKIVDEFSLEVVNGIEGLQIEQFRFEQAKEIFHNSIVQTVAFTAHALADVVISQQPLVELVLVLPTLIGVQDRFCPRGQNGNRLFYHGGDHGKDGAIRDGVSYQIGRVQIKNRREIKLLAKESKLGDVSNPLLVRSSSMEVSLQQIGRHLAHFALVGAVLLHPDTTNQIELLHQPSHGLVIGAKAAIFQFLRDSAVAVASSITMEDLCDLLFDFCVFVNLL